MNAYCYFSFKGDQGCLEHSIASVRRADPSAMVAVFDDDKLPCSRDAGEPDHYERTSFDRQVNLNGRECVISELVAFSKVVAMWSPDNVIKIDCDTVVQRPNFSDWGEYDLLGSSPDPEIVYGPLYVLKPWIVAPMLHESISFAPLPRQEDWAISVLARAVGGHVRVAGFSEDPRFLSGFAYSGQDSVERSRRASAVTFGNRMLLKEEGQQARDKAAESMGTYLRF